MTDSELDPHVLISCRVSENPKIIDLPNDRARWGWVILMGKAKLQRPPGRFASLRVAAAVLVGGRLREQGAGIAIEAIEFKGDALGWHTVHGVQDMGGEFSHGIYAGQYPANRPPVWPDPATGAPVRELPARAGDFRGRTGTNDCKRIIVNNLC